MIQTPRVELSGAVHGSARERQFPEVYRRRRTNPPKPISPEVKRSKEDGSGTEVAGIGGATEKLSRAKVN